MDGLRPSNRVADMREKKAKKKASRGFVIANVVLWSAAVIVVGWVMLQNRPGSISVPGGVANNAPAVAGKAPPPKDPEEINYGTNILGKAPITVGIDGAKLLKQPKLSPEGFWIEDFYQASNGNLVEDLADEAVDDAVGAAGAVVGGRLGKAFGAIVDQILRCSCDHRKPLFGGCGAGRQWKLALLRPCKFRAKKKPRENAALSVNREASNRVEEPLEETQNSLSQGGL